MIKDLSDSSFNSFHAPIRIYSSYRFLLSLIFLGIAIRGHANFNYFPLSPAFTLTLVYFILALGFFVGAMHKSLPIARHTFIGFVVDITFIALLEYTSVSRDITLDVILIVAIAAGSIVFTGRLGTSLAAIATIVLCGKTFLLNKIGPEVNTSNLRTALLGITFFATSWITQTLAKRLQESEGIATQQARDIETLQNLNQTIVERMRTGIAVFSKNLSLEMMNDAALHLLSTNPTNALDASSGLILVKNNIEIWLKDGNQSLTIQVCEQAPEIKLGFTFLDNQRVLVFLEDNTKLKQHAQQLKLASLGQLAASIAHEIRNPLAAVSYATQLLAESQPSETQIDLLSILSKHTARMNDIVNNVLQISSRQPPNNQIILLTSWLETFTKTVFSKVQNQLIVQNISESVVIDFDPSHLSQVLTNLIENAIQAMTETTQYPNGKVTITGGNLENMSRPFLNIHNTGKSISAEISPHIFEPFFTTSKTGSGLGLFLCREICELNHARIHLLPVTEGTCFQILFKPRTING